MPRGVSGGPGCGAGATEASPGASQLYHLKRAGQPHAHSLSQGLSEFHPGCLGVPQDPFRTSTRLKITSMQTLQCYLPLYIFIFLVF